MQGRIWASRCVPNLQEIPGILTKTGDFQQLLEIYLIDILILIGLCRVDKLDLSEAGVSP